MLWCVCGPTLCHTLLVWWESTCMIEIRMLEGYEVDPIYGIF